MTMSPMGLCVNQANGEVASSQRSLAVRGFLRWQLRPIYSGGACLPCALVLSCRSLP